MVKPQSSEKNGSYLLIWLEIPDFFEGKSQIKKERLAGQLLAWGHEVKRRGLSD